MDEKPDINNLINENELLRKQLEEQKNGYKKLSSELGQSIFEYEDLDLKNRALKKENAQLKEEIEELKKFKEEVESSKGWKIIKLFK
ncbi:MAG TPA: hypothetical protein HA277_06305 [Methanosphaera sp.]|nr:hypothetical protein [Methanosphaera sp.]HII08048.1 hypothetical protein [Methanosphaera sp.]HIJ15995.1 hypothetical protein [Methanosphaera sp.]